MPITRVSRVVFRAFLAAGLLSLQPAFADTFTSYVVGTSAGSISNYGLTAGGTLVTFQATLPNLTYMTFTPPSTLSTSVTAPALAYDNGVACAPTNTGAYSSVLGVGRCNGAYEVFQAAVGGSLHYSLFDGPDPVANLVSNLASGGYDNFLINSRGDIAAVAVTVPSASADQNLLFVRAVTPEPSSIALLGTGLLGIAGVVRQRVRVINDAG